ncbi:MAG TPA: glycine zipper 2TM domain-containing protein [Noviherbaspirillum sp.]
MNSRQLMRTFAAVIVASSLAGCGTLTRQQVGIGTGAVVGGAAGHAVTGGSTLGTVGGAAVGGVIGNEVAKPKR